MRILTLTTLYPNCVQRRNGIFVRERLMQLRQRFEVDVTVIAPVPWFPSTHQRFGRYAEYAQVPWQEEDDGITVLHPRFVVVPRISDWIMPLTYFAAVKSAMRRHRIGAFDLIDVHFAFPDGAAGAMLSKSLGLPCVLTVRGSDINLMPEERAAGHWIRFALERVDACVAVSSDLARRVAQLVPSSPDAHVIRNGVDRSRFHVMPSREAIRQSLGLRGMVVLAVGNLIELKGHHLVIEAIRDLPKAELVIVGKGPLRRALEVRSRECGVADRVRFVEEMPQDELVRYYNAADVLVSASSNEGCPNVVLEALSCGTPVVSTPTGGAREIIESPDCGCIVERDVPSIVRGVRDVVAHRCAREVVSRMVDSFDWTKASTDLHALFGRCLRIGATRNTAEGTSL